MAGSYLALVSGMPMAAGCEGNFLPEAAGCGVFLCGRVPDVVCSCAGGCRMWCVPVREGAECGVFLCGRVPDVSVVVCLGLNRWCSNKPHQHRVMLHHAAP